MTEAKKIEPDEDLLEFLGGIDEVNGDSKDGDFSDFLANADIYRVASRPPSPGNSPPVKEDKRE